MNDYQEWAKRPSAGQRMLLILSAVILLAALFMLLIPRFSGQLPAGQATLPTPAPPTQPPLSPVFSPEVHYWETNILLWSAEHKLDPDIVATIMQIESCGDPGAVSIAGAQGLFQVMPFHFGAGEDTLDPGTNARRGLAYFVDRLAQTNGDIGRAFAGYNGGQAAAASSFEYWAAETQRYYVWATGIYQDAKAGLAESPTLQQWLAAGGANLCRQAANRLELPAN